MRQAVIIIHGIGEQLPMQTLRAFVAGVLAVPERELEKHAFSKPDRISDLLELRRLSVRGGLDDSDKNSETDFYELYWQHLMQDTAWRPVVSWLLYLLCHPGRFWDRERSRKLWILGAMIVAATAVATAIVLTITWPMYKDKLLAVWLAIAVPSLVLLVPPVLAFLRWLWRGQLERLVLGYFGDAFRYLNPYPANVAARRAIRTAGLTLLRGLHEDKLRRYQRIVLVGHSLGSVIAYDLITWFWQEQHHRIEPNRKSRERKILPTYPLDLADGKSPLKRLDELASDNIDHFRTRQWQLGQEHRDNHHLPWLITDLVTLGSPLTYANVLLADGQHNFEIAARQREFPTCPPQQEDPRDHRLLWRSYDGSEHPVRILHHGAPFAVTRWTNLFFPGDIIGGRVAGLFGRGIKDVELKCGNTAHELKSHIHYWEDGEACCALRTALCLKDPSAPDSPAKQGKKSQPARSSAACPCWFEAGSPDQKCWCGDK